MGLRRGFKTEAEAIAADVRRELGLAPYQPLSPWVLAEHLGVPLLKLSALRAAAPDAVQYLLRNERGAFSAVTVFRDAKRLVVYNDGHSVGRQASDLAHEIAHALLLHSPHSALDENGCRVWSPTMEEEADWLGGALLVPGDAAYTVARRGTALPDAAREYGVSVTMMRYRLNVTGAARRVARAAARRR